MMRVSRQMYCQYLLSSQTKYNQSHFAEHVEGLTHDGVYRHLKYDKLTPSLVWEHVKPIMKQSSHASIIFDDTI
ncbi:MAG: transposase, partial [Dolichospermum sp.]